MNNIRVIGLNLYLDQENMERARHWPNPGTRLTEILKVGILRAKRTLEVYPRNPFLREVAWTSFVASCALASPRVLGSSFVVRQLSLAVLVGVLRLAYRLSEYRYFFAAGAYGSRSRNVIELTVHREEPNIFRFVVQRLTVIANRQIILAYVYFINNPPSPAIQLVRPTLCKGSRCSAITID